MKKIAIILIVGSLMSCACETEKASSGENDLADKISYQDEINTKVIFDSGQYKMILFAIKKDQILEPHSASMDTPLLILEGSARITIGAEESILGLGETIILPKNIDHGVYPITNVKFLLIK